MRFAEEIQAAAKGKPSCEKCAGKGSYIFMGCEIFCESCHGEEKITALWQGIDSYIRR